MLRLILVMLLAAASNPARSQNASVIFTPESGFSGRSEGDGVLRLFFRSKNFHVESRGFDRHDGTFQLDQAVQFAGKPAENRTWIIRALADSKYTATLTGAAGAVTGETVGSQLHLRYRAKRLIVVHQTLTLSADGKSIDNEGRITLLGIPIGSLHELIRRED